MSWTAWVHEMSSPQITALNSHGFFIWSYMLNDLTDQKITKYPMLTTSQKLHITINQILATSQKCKYGKDVQGMKKKRQQIKFQ